VTSVVLSTPTNGNVIARAAESAERASLTMPFGRVRPESSVLTEAHNQGWAAALNMSPRPAIFAQQHADISAEPGWLDTLIEELATHNAGLIAAVVAIKDARGLSSTSVYDPAWRTHRRITMRELQGLPETFSVSDIPWAPPGAILLNNTGLWACRFGDWCEQIVFTIRDFILRSPEGEYASTFWPEDWNFSQDAARLGVKVMATRKIAVDHFGAFPFKNSRAWGSLAEDDWHPVPFAAPGKTQHHLGGYQVGGDSKTWAPEVWSELLAMYDARSVLDVGAGEGHAARWFAARGCKTTAVEGEARAVEVLRLRGIDTLQADFEAGPVTVPPHDLAWCCEVVEHVSEEKLPNLLAALRSCRRVAMTHALPGQAGHHHVNCRDADYWIATMDREGFRYEREESERLRSLTGAQWVRQSLMVFERAA
jgi:SAM-dependent methyltransferase